jgi:GrpB-like predicted nucleotidyltransferase (UPF0157 family)
MNQIPIRPFPHPPPHPAVCDWNPRAPKAAQRVIALISERLPNVTIAHVGSSAVTGCAGKGYLDFVIPYDDDAHLTAINDALFSLGFGRQDGRDPFPETRPMRTGAFAHEGETFLLHVHVVLAESGQADELIAFRDRLRNDSSLVADYVAVKHAILDAGVSDAVEYAQRKGDFFAVLEQLPASGWERFQRDGYIPGG